MPNIILLDNPDCSPLFPLCATRPVSELRVGALRISEKWERYLGLPVSYTTAEHLRHKYPTVLSDDNLIINAALVPDQALAARISAISNREFVTYKGELIAVRLGPLENREISDVLNTYRAVFREWNQREEPPLINRLPDLLRLMPEALLQDISLLTAGRASQPLPSTVQALQPDRIFIEEGARLSFATINASEGPVYIGPDVEIMEGAMLRGPIAILKGAQVRMGARIYGPCVIGPGCKVGGELAKSVLLANSNKAHDGYLGDSYIGEWCNLGADTNTSNLKNNYSEVKLWDYATGRFERTGAQFLGLFMGDHAKCGINTMFNTGTVVGVFANIFGAGYPRNFIPDFAWGGAESPWRTYDFEEACKTAKAVLARRNMTFDAAEKNILYHIYRQTAGYRTWERQV